MEWTKNPIVALVLVVVAVGVVVLVAVKMRGPADTTADAWKEKLTVMCITPGCDYTTQMAVEEAGLHPPGEVGPNNLWKCPKCGKYSVGFALTCSKHGEYVAIRPDQPCPKCAAERGPDRRASAPRRQVRRTRRKTGQVPS